MQLKSLFDGIKFISGHSFVCKNKRKALLLIPVLLVVYFGIFLLEPPAIADLSKENRYQVPQLLSQWDKGKVVVLLRHLERCDREDYPCFVGTSGITSRAVPDGHKLGKSFYRLGLNKSDVYNSPLTRTAQTEDIVFNGAGTDQEWLYKCRRETLLDDVLKIKKPGRNLILVTHSSCIANFEEALGYDSDTPHYGSSLFFAEDPETQSLHALGFLDSDDWDTSFGFLDPALSYLSEAGQHRTVMAYFPAPIRRGIMASP